MGFKQRLAQIKCKRVKEKGVSEVFQCKKLKIKRQRQKIHLVKAFRCKLKHNYQFKLNQRHHLDKGFQCRKVHLYKNLYLLFQIKGLPPQVLAALRWSKSKIPVKPKTVFNKSQASVGSKWDNSHKLPHSQILSLPLKWGRNRLMRKTIKSLHRSELVSVWDSNKNHQCKCQFSLQPSHKERHQQCFFHHASRTWFQTDFKS